LRNRVRFECWQRGEVGCYRRDKRVYHLSESDVTGELAELICRSS